jgi:nucleotide-binding universal stress UspA family protein
VFRNLLVAIDGSPSAERALSEATELAVAVNARLTIISVVPPVPGNAYRSGVDLAALREDIEAETERLMREVVDSLPQDLPATTVIKHGHPGEEIVKQVKEGGHDLLVMGSRGLGRVTANLFGTVGGYVHYHSRVAMLVVQSEEDEPGA